MLQIRDRAGLWEYHNFTSDSSFWANGDYNLILQFMNEDYDKIELLELTLLDHKNIELNLFIKQFKMQYGLVSKYN